MNFFIHIGTHKTGSTSLQHCFLFNRLKLIEQGYLYPETGIKDAGHHEVAWACRDANNQELLNGMIQSIIVEAETANCENVILSSEEFEFIGDLQYLQSALGKHHCKIIVYLRRQDTLLESEYNQHVKMPITKYTHDIYKFHFDHDFHLRFNYKNLCHAWSQAFGQEALSIVSFDHCAKQPQGIFNALFKIANIPNFEELVLSDTDRHNVSLPNNATIYLARLNTLSLTSAQHALAIRLLKQLFHKQLDRPLLTFSDRLRLWNRYQTINHFIENRFQTHCFNQPSKTEYDIPSIDFYNDFNDRIYTSLLFNILNPSPK